MDAVNIKNLSFKYNDQSENCISNLNLKVLQGERFGLFGPNGAGKTTLMNCMTGLLKFTEGSIQLLGNHVTNHTKKVNLIFGFVPQDFSFYQELTPIENLAFFGAWYGMSKINIKQKTTELLDVLKLTEVANKQVQKFSGGMKRRVNLAIGVMHNPKILFLDEPTVGVDIHTRHAIIEYLKAVNQQGTTLIYTSHQLSEAEDLCNHIALIDDGKILVHNTLHNLLQTYNANGLEDLFLQLAGKSFKNYDV